MKTDAYRRMRVTTRLWIVLLWLAPMAGAVETSMKEPMMKTPHERPANRLAHETSPYLLQHAHNPVDWFPWGEEAFAKARKENKPLFLSIGYSACHWCHVMEHESFEDPETAEILNRDFVAIKVDREEHPDVDTIYMNAVQLMTGSGGWPLSVFLTPELKPFFGGTYFPVEERYGMPSFKTVLAKVTTAWTDRRKDIAAGADEVTKALASLNRPPAPATGIETGAVESAVQQLKASFDGRWGGFGHSPKFPPTGTLALLLRHHARTGDPDALKMVTTTLDRMAQGGICDQLGGGFHRYSVDEQWLVPHFEKMLYDNALLSRVYLDACQLAPTPRYREVAVATLDYVIRDMTDTAGGFYASQDADSEGVEGKYYVWSRSEIEKILKPGAADLLLKYYGITAAGNFEGKNILTARRTPAEFAADQGLQADVFERNLADGRRQLLEARGKRVRPGQDIKIIASWNGLMISAFARGYQVLGEERFRTAAEKAAAFVTASMLSGDELVSSYAQGRPGGPAYLDDYAAMADGLLDLYDATFDVRWLHGADALARTMIARFSDSNGGGLYLTWDAHPHLLVRIREYADNVMPSGNSVAAHALLRLGRLMDRPHYTELAEGILKAASPDIAEQPTGFPCMLMAAEFATLPALDIVIVGKTGSPDTQQMLSVVRQFLLPTAVLSFADPSDVNYSSLVKQVPLLRDRPMRNGLATAYVCENFTCRQPVTDPEELRKLLAARSKGMASRVGMADSCNAVSTGAKPQNVE